MTAEISQELAIRMAACLRDMTKWSGVGFSHPGTNALAEARAIVALLPEPVNPDLVEARKLADYHSERARIKRLTPYSAGTYDHDPVIVALLAALTRGRELALKARDGE